MFGEAAMRASFLVLTCLFCRASHTLAQAVPVKDELQVKVDEAVDRGGIYLTKLLAGDFVGRQPVQDAPGVGSVIGWALLEAGLPADHAKLQSLAEQVRQMSIGAIKTYSLSFAIIFLDRLGEKRDALLIQALATRLLEGQLQSGGWSYTCLPEPRENEREALREYYKVQATNDADKASAMQASLQQHYTGRVSGVNRTPLLALKGGATDNSNTQLAALALWVARRHGVQTDRALQLAALRFRSTQQRNGRWAYDIERPDYGQAMSMTCAGLIVMALGRGTVAQQDLAKGLAADPFVNRGFAALHTFLKLGLPKLTSNDVNQLTENSKTFYSLWSLERTCVLYNVERIYNSDWYAWGANYLLETQQPEGNWAGHYDRHFAADTCFALLFLRRANPAKDLATKIKTKLNFAIPIQKSAVPCSPSETSRSLFELKHLERYGGQCAQRLRHTAGFVGRLGICLDDQVGPQPWHDFFAVGMDQQHGAFIVHQ
jgi:hypothetical protein